MDSIIDSLNGLKLNVSGTETSQDLIPPPIPMRKSYSVGNVAVNRPMTIDTQSPHHQLYQVMRETIMKEVYLTIPTLVQHALAVQLPPSMRNFLEEEGWYDNSTSESPLPTMAHEHKSSRAAGCSAMPCMHNESDILNKLRDYKVQVDECVQVTKKINETELPNLKQEIADVREEITSPTNATTGNKITQQVTDIDEAQQFVSDKYDKLINENKHLNVKVDRLEKNLEKQATKSERNANYSRWENVKFGGINRYYLRDGVTEDCKTMIVNVCRELNYNIPINEISTAHRLKQHHSKTGPPPIVVRFKDRDIRNDVLRLRSLARDKQTWRNYGITRLFINEHLTPEKGKLMYETKVFTREMNRIHGKIFVWSFKGEIFIRKGIEYAPRIKINNANDLDEIRRGSIKLDPLPEPSNVLSLADYPLMV